MTGRFRRAIRLDAAAGIVRGEVEDDFHHFVVTVRHDGDRVTAVTGSAVRYPWSRCPGAAGALEAVVGLPISTDPTAIYRHLDPLGQCTHMFELAGLAVGLAGRGEPRRRYDVSVTDPDGDRVEAVLLRDGAAAEQWVLEAGVIVSPPGRAGQGPVDLRTAALEGLPHAEAETLLILRRAIRLAAARDLDVDRFATAADFSRRPACFVFRPGVAEHAHRRYGSVRDFSAGPGPLPGDPP